MVDEWLQVPPRDRELFLEREFIVFPRYDGTCDRRGPPKLYFVASELFGEALGQKNYYSKLSKVEKKHKVYKRIQRNAGPQVCISETAVQKMLHRVRYTGRKLELVLYLNANYDVTFSMRPFNEDEPPCVFCLGYEADVKKLRRERQFMLQEIRRLRKKCNESEEEEEEEIDSGVVTERESSVEY